MGTGGRPLPAGVVNTSDCTRAALGQADSAGMDSFACWHKPFARLTEPGPVPPELVACSMLLPVAAAEHRVLAICSLTKTSGSWEERMAE